MMYRVEYWYPNRMGATIIYRTYKRRWMAAAVKWIAELFPDFHEYQWVSLVEVSEKDNG